MTHFTELRLRNFRCFQDATLTLSPLTLLLGPNSAGKSSFIHALLGLRQTHLFGRSPSLDTPANTSEDEWPIDLGTHGDLAYRGTSAPVQIALNSTAGWFEFGFGGSPAGRLNASLLSIPVYPGVTQPPEALPPADPNTVFEIGNVIATAEWSPERRQSFVRQNDAFWQMTEGSESVAVRIVFQGLMPISIVKDTGTTVPFQSAPFNQLENSLRAISYLRPARVPPRRRHERESSDFKGVGPAGERTANVLLELGATQPACWSKPPVCPTNPAHALELLNANTDWLLEETTLGEAVNAWMQHLGLANQVTATLDGEKVRLDAVVSNGQRARPLTEVGYGVGQALPIIVAGLLMGEGDWLLVEQPEAQLHPRAQAGLADFLCSLVLSGRHVLAETHSEHLFHRLRLRGAMSSRLQAKIGTTFIHREAAEDARLTRVGIAEDEEFSWPDGFMTTGIDGELSLLAARAARARRGERP